MSETEQAPPNYGDAKAQEAARVEQETNAPTTTTPVVEEAAQPQVQTTTNVTIVQNQQVF